MLFVDVRRAFLSAPHVASNRIGHQTGAGARSAHLRAAPASACQHVRARRLHICHSSASSVEEQPSTSAAALGPDPWAKCFELLETAEIVDTVVTGYNRGGLIVQLEGLRGFIPYHQLNPGRLRKGHQGDFDFIVGTQLQARIMLVDVQGNRKSLILSERQATIAAAMSGLAVGQVVRGEVARLEDYGAFLRLPDYPPVQGLVQLGEISWNKMLAPDPLLTLGQEVKAVVMEVNTAKCRLALSLKRLQADPLKQSVGSQEVQWQPAASPRPEVERIMRLLQQQDGVAGVSLVSESQAGAVASQELEVWLTREEVEDGFNVVVRDGNTQQQLHLSTTLPRQGVIALLQQLLRSAAAGAAAPASDASAASEPPAAGSA